MQSDKIVFTGMRPTGKLHLGHYLGVIENMVKLQDEYKCYFFIADWHALTTKYDKTEGLKQDIIDVATDWLACGIDPNKSTIYVQSLIPETAELHIYLSMITPQNWVERDPNLKDMAKILRSKEGFASQINYGLMGYPVLMTADILSFNADFVPVGVDQVAHVELTRDIARRFNNIYKTDFFKETQPLLNSCPLLCGLDGNKMGKSFNNDIKISDTEEVTAKKVMSAITDRSRMRKDDPGHPDECEVAFKYWKIFGVGVSQRCVRHRQAKHVAYREAASAARYEMTHSVCHKMRRILSEKQGCKYELSLLKICAQISVLQRRVELIVEYPDVIYPPRHAASACDQLHTACICICKIGNSIIHDAPPSFYVVVIYYNLTGS